MKGIVICDKGCEDVSKKEVKELIKANGKVGSQVVVFDIKNKLDLCKLCYLGQSFVKVLFLFDSFKFKDLDEIIKRTDKIKLKEWLKDSFRVKCVRIGSHSFSSHDVEKKVGEVIYEKFKIKVNLENPGLIFYVFINEDACYLGVDFAGFDLSKRDYRIFNHPSALKGSIAYSLLRMAGFNGKQNVLDPFCGSGTVIIEAALFASKFSVNHFRKDKFAFKKLIDKDFDKFFEKLDKAKKPTSKLVGYDNQFRYVQASNKNAKIAGIDKFLYFSRADVDWLDTKADEKGVDLIVSNPPSYSKFTEKKAIDKIYNELFYQAEFVLKRKGKVFLIARHDKFDVFAEKYKFKRIFSNEVMQGKEKFFVSGFGR